MGKTEHQMTRPERRTVVPPDGVTKLEGAIMVEAHVLAGILRRKVREMESDRPNGVGKGAGTRDQE